MKISIITVTFNSAKTLRDTLKSIESQDFDQIEIGVAQIDRPNRTCRARPAHWAFGDRDTLIAQ